MTGRFVSMVVATLAGIVLFQSTSVVGSPADSRTPTDFSLEQLVSKSSAIVLAFATPRVGATAFVERFPATVAAFKVIDAIGGGLRAGQVLEVKQLVPRSVSFQQKGELVLWFMEGGPVETSLVNPVGYASGDFRVVSAENDPIVMVRNGASNRNLWGQRLWQGKFVRHHAATYLRKHLSEKSGKWKEDPQGLETHIKQILDVGESPLPEGHAVPLELLMAAVHAARDMQ